jgi:hypothetical protein
MHGVVTYVCDGLQEMTSCYVMTGQQYYDVRGVEPREVVVYKLYYVTLRASVSTSSLIQACLLLSSCAPPPLLVISLSTCAEQVTLMLTSSHSPLEL